MREWASQQQRTQVVAILDAALDSDGAAARQTAVTEVKDGIRRGLAAMHLIRASLRGSGADLTAFADELASAEVDSASPREGPTLGGRCRLQGLQGAAELNGQIGRIVSWNDDGRRRYSVRLESTGKLISCKSRNAVAVDAPQLAYSHDFDCSSAEFVAALQAELRAQGSPRLVVDWTPLAREVGDVVHLMHVAHDISYIPLAAAMAQGRQGQGDGDEEVTTPISASEIADDCTEAAGALLFIRAEPQSEPFFLAHRELIGPAATLHTNAHVAAVPWILINKGLTAVPQPWEQCCKKEYMVRVCLNLVQPEFTCVICHEECQCAGNPSQLPCAHFICTSCLRKLSTPVGALDIIHNLNKSARGLTCPVCRTHFPKHVVGEHAAAPGGVAIFESV